MTELRNSKRVLVTHSLLDDSVRRRMQQTAESPRLRTYIIDHFFVWTGPDREFKTLGRRLTEKIDYFRPDIVIVHGGFAFLTDEEQYIGIMNGVIRRHPSIAFVAEGFLLGRDDFAGVSPDDDDELFNLVLLTR